jgi:cytochrome P450
MTELLDLASWEPGYTEDPYPLLARLREQAPVSKVVIDGLSVWLVTRYDDIRKALSDARLSNDPAIADAATRAVPWVSAAASGGVSRHMLRLDPPDHTRLRRLVAKAFTPRRLEALRPRIQQIADELVTTIQPLGRADLLTDLAVPLPLTVIAELLGVPTTQAPEFARWVNIYAGVDEGDAARVPQALAWLGDYLARLIERKQSEQVADAEHGSLLDGLIAVRDEGERLSHDELLAMSFLLLLAGYETTVNLIGNGLLSLLRNPDQYAALRADPALLRPAIEELLRYEPPVKVAAALRVTTTEMTIGDVLIPAHQPVLFCFAAANRDPAHFSDPDRLDIFRPEREHLAFSHGIHVCLGAPLARLEAEVAFATVLAGLPDLALAAAPDELPWRRSRLIRGLKRLPVTFTARTGAPKHAPVLG